MNESKSENVDPQSLTLLPVVKNVFEASRPRHAFHMERSGGYLHAGCQGLSRNAAREWRAAGDDAELVHPDDPHAVQSHLVLRFLWPQGVYESLVSAFVKSPVHVDIHLHKPRSKSNLFTYTAFAGENFSINMLTQELASSDRYENLAIPVSEREITALQEYCMAMVDNVPYNYRDLALVAGFAGSGDFRDVMFPDFKGDNPYCTPRVFCSQACVLAMKNCLDCQGRESLRGVLDPMNSRAVAPSELYCAMQPHGFLVTGESLRSDALVKC